MSQRAIKRYERVLQAEKARTEEQDIAEHVSSDTASDASNTPPGGRQSLFALLSISDDDTHDTDSSCEQPSTTTEPTNVSEENRPCSDTVEEEEQLDKTTDHPESVSLSNHQSAPKKRKKKKKKKSNRRKSNSMPDQQRNADDIASHRNGWPSDEDDLLSASIPTSYFAEDDEDDVREEAKKIMSFIESIVHGNQSAESSQLSSISVVTNALHVEPRLLNADSELKRLFGSKVVEMGRRDDEASNPQTARRRARTVGRAHIRRRISLVSPRDTWVGHAPGLTMVIDSEATNMEDASIRYFRYKHEQSYARVQDEYRSCVELHDPNLLVTLSGRHPYHVDTLLQLAELYRQMGELDRAAEQIERCLYVMETSWNISFKPYNGKCRLRFDVIENRCLYIALFRYSQLLTRRGLHRTALEISKLLLNFDPEHDPMGMLMLVDSFALLSGEYEWIKEMRENYSYIPIQYFPNFAASSSVASQSVRLGISGISNRGSSAKSKSSGKSTDKKESGSEGWGDADELLVEALLTFPMILKPLLSVIQDSSGVWMEFRLFDEGWYSAGYEDYGVLVRMCRVYAERSKLLWNSTNNKEMLIRCARKAGELDTAAGMGIDPVTGRTTSAIVQDASEHERVANCRALRAEAGEWLRESGLYRNVQIADFSDSTTNLPAELLAGDEAEQPLGAIAPAPPRDVSVVQGALEFLQSMLPWREARDAQ